MEVFKHNISTKKALARTGAALLLATPFAVAACDTKPAAAPCESPRATSKRYPADPLATADRHTWENGVAIHTAVPADTEGVIVGYNGEGNDSKPLTADQAQSIAVLVGNHAVDFNVHLRAPAGSPTCLTAPKSLFSEMQPYQPLVDSGATQPRW